MPDGVILAHELTRDRRVGTRDAVAAPSISASLRADRGGRGARSGACGLASRLLRDRGRAAEVAAAVGCDFEAACSRAFKKLVNRSPAAWRAAQDA